MNRAFKSAALLAAAVALVSGHDRVMADSTHIATGPVTSWTYGWTPGIAGTFTPLEGGFNYHGMPAWSRTPLYPIIAFNNSLNEPPKGLGTFRVPKNRLVLVPGQAGELAVVRWTADANGRYLVQGLFDGLDECVNANAYILSHGTTTLLTTTVVGPERKPFSLQVSLHRNETLDFAVDYGSNQSIHCDVVGLSALVTLFR